MIIPGESLSEGAMTSQLLYHVIQEKLASDGVLGDVKAESPAIFVSYIPGKTNMCVSVKIVFIRGQCKMILLLFQNERGGE